MKKQIITHESVVLFPESNITKGEIVRYYQRLAPLMLRSIRNHIIMLKRYPQGIESTGFYQKNSPDYFPSWITTKRLKKQTGGWVRFIVADHPATITYLANQYTISFHAWLSALENLHYPDRMIFDLDPSPGVSFNQVRDAAFRLKDLLHRLGLMPFVMTTGSRGVHVVVPLRAQETFEAVYSFAFQVAQILTYDDPRSFTLNVRKDKRGKRIFIDVLRNGYGATSIAPYSVRAREQAPVATPLLWEELPTTEPQEYTIHNIETLLRRRGDPWAHFKRFRRLLTKPRPLLEAELKERDLLLFEE